MSKYYYLIAGLPDLNLDDTKLSYTVADFKTELYTQLSDPDKKLIDLFYLKFDNANVLKLLKDKDAEIDDRGTYSAEQLTEYIDTIKEGTEINSSVFPSYLSAFIQSYFESSEEDESLLEDSLAGLYFKYAMNSGSRFVTSWFRFNLIMNNILVALSARKYKLDVSQRIVGDGDISDALRSSGARDFGLSGEVEFFDQLTKIGEISDLVERERKIDALCWNWVEDETFFDYFTIERIFAYLVKLEIIERWINLDKEEGSRKFREIIESLKNDVQIPAEFR